MPLRPDGRGRGAADRTVPDRGRTARALSAPRFYGGRAGRAGPWRQRKCARLGTVDPSGPCRRLRCNCLRPARFRVFRRACGFRMAADRPDRASSTRTGAARHRSIRPCRTQLRRIAGHALGTGPSGRGRRPGADLGPGDGLGRRRDRGALQAGRPSAGGRPACPQPPGS